MVAVAKPVSGAVPVEGADAAASTRSEFRKAPADVNRIPGSAASMKVQERSKADATSSSASTSTWATPATSRATAPTIASLRNRTAIQAMQPFLDSSTTADSPIQPTDIQLLTTSILSNQERQRVILSYQEKLIHSQPALPELKQSLLFLSSSSWGQILEERKLADKCAYPPCHRPSPSSSTSGAARGKFRINLRTQSVRAVDDLDLGEAGHTYDDLRDYFCSKPCYARSEWILRWVLSDKEIALPDSQGLPHGSSGGGAALQGKWQKLTSQPGGYEHIELLEDIEREQGVRLDSLDPEQSLHSVEESSPPTSSSGTATASTSRRDAPPATPAKCDVTNLLGDLTIVERSKPPPLQHPSTGSTANAPLPSRTAYTVDVPNTLGARFTSSTTTSTAAADDAREVDLETDLDERERELAHVLRYASLARGSRPRRRNLTVRLDTGSPATSTTSTSTSTTRARQGAEQPPPAESHSSETVDAQHAAERREIRRLMDVALDVRRAQREQGLLD